ncbi:uncharacterized protein EI97DRAFT_433292 [Westerdykella ornata]|uniref:Uncharacterized protein n=1 Tax=Westerdykella ornata TaxID=318751 RepID=A0A6A6JII8_WESOR|nr:uncharacterized protein EI97DRAFT_433292 [Westerdykella ornata]KAF2276460.1 hypothetical protein EI97DRAFT_433292 [Westerdykella ornata]
MSELTSTSFFDDGVDIATRMPTSSSSWDISKWLDHIPTSDSATVGESGSFFDDGADLLVSGNEALEATSGLAKATLGRANSKFYDDPRPRNQMRGFHKGVERAVGGQIRNTLESMRATEDFRIRAPSGEENGRIESEQGCNVEGGPVREAVKMWLPPTPPDFVIHGKDGHVILVDGSGEPIDSRPPPELEQRLKGAVKEPEWYKSKDNEGQQRKQKASQEIHSEKKKSDKEAGKDGKGPDMPLPVPDFLLSGFGLASKAPSLDSWQNGRPEDARSNYRAPTVESVPNTPEKGKMRVGSWEPVW